MKKPSFHLVLVSLLLSFLSLLPTSAGSTLAENTGMMEEDIPHRHLRRGGVGVAATTAAVNSVNELDHAVQDGDSLLAQSIENAQEENPDRELYYYRHHWRHHRYPYWRRRYWHHRRYRYWDW